MMRFKVGEQAVLLYARTNPHIDPVAGTVVTVMHIGPFASYEMTPTGQITPLGGDYIIGTCPNAQANRTRCVLDVQLAKLTEPDPDSANEVCEELEEEV